MYQNKFPIVLFFFLLTVRCHQVPNQNDISDEDIFDNVLSIKLKHMDGLNKILKETDLTYLVYYYKRTSRNSIQGARMLYNIAHRLDFLAQIIMIDCEDIEPSDTPQCVKDPNAEDGFPRIEVYEPPTFKYNPYTKQMSNHTRKIYSNREVGENLLYNFVTQNIPSRAIKLTRENFDAFAKNMDMNKVILFTDKPKTPLLYRGISNFYYDQILFGEVSKDEHALIQKFKVTSFPTLLVYQTHEEEIPLSEPYVEKFGGKIIAQNIAQFLQPYVLKQKHYLKTNLTDNVNELKYKVIFKKLKTANVISYLTKFKNNHFVIYFDNKIDNDNVDLTALADDVKRFNKETYGFFMFIHLDCTDNEEECAKNFDVREYPSMLLVKKSEQTLTERIRKALPLPFDYSEIYKEITREFLGQFKETNGQVFSSTLRESTLDNKIPFIYFYNSEEIPLGLHLISTDSKFSGKIELILYENPRPEVLREMQITKLPQLNIMLLDPNEMKNARVVNYAEELVYARLKSFISQYFINDSETKTETEEEPVKKDITFLSDNESLDKYCAMKKLCMVAFLDGRTNKNSMDSFDRSISVLEEVHGENQKKPITFGWVNATCHGEFSSNFNVYSESLPGLVIYVPNKEVYTKFIGTFDKESINEFITKTLSGKTSVNKINKEQALMKDIKCADIKEILETEDDDELMKEIIEEERKKREQFEKEREELEDKKKKKKKKKKKDDL